MNDFPATLVDGGVTARKEVRGPRFARRDSVHHCRHCGSPVPADREFCCAGCAYVHRLVHEHGFAAYYRLRDAAVAPVDSGVFQARDFSWLAELQEAAERDSTAAATLTLEIQGISCAACVWLIEKVFQREPGALEAVTDAAAGRIELRWARGQMDLSEFAMKLQSFGYLLGPPGVEPAVPETRLLARRLGLSAAFSMNIMLFTLPVYFGMEASFGYARLFGTLSMVFATLSLLSGGAYFIGRAWQAVRARALHIDLPIAVGILGAFGGSFYGWATQREEFVYFDFVGAFIVLMLAGRWAQVAAVERNRRRLLRAPARPERVRRREASGDVTPVRLGDIRRSDIIVLRAGEVLPVEAQLRSGPALFGLAWISGEAEPRLHRPGACVPAGAILAGHDDAELRVTQGWADSLLARLLQPGRREGYRHRLLERVVAGYLVAIFAVAGGAGLAWWLATGDAVRVWSVVTAVLVVSCPCAVGLAFPLADEIAAAAARRAGVFVREADLWPRLTRVRRLLFDKTGTLTLESPTLRNPRELDRLSPVARGALLTLVRDNAHPVCQTLLQELLALPDAGGWPLPEGRYEENPGIGVRLATPGGDWRLGRPGWGEGRAGEAGSVDAEFVCDGAVLARFQFTDSLRPDAREEIAAWQRDGFAVHVLSGDREEKVRSLAAELGLPASQARGGLTPTAKAAAVSALDARDTLMLGDGANDSLAFDAAFVRGTPVIHRGVLQEKADFYYLGQGLGGLRRLFAINAARRRTHAALLASSVAYNAVAVGLAATGRMSPLLAAILMPVSSLLSLAIVSLGMRRVGKVVGNGTGGA